MAEKFPYEDIINLPPHISKKHPQPTMMDRAARFAPFAAITGYEEMVLEEARITEERIDLDEGTLSILNEKLNMIQEFIDEEPEVTITYFEPDKKKSGGAYIDITGTVKRIDEYECLVIMTDGKKIRIEDIYGLESDLFYSLGVDDYSGTEYDLITGAMTAYVEKKRVSSGGTQKSRSRKNSVHRDLVLQAEALLNLAKRCDSRTNKDNAKFAAQIRALFEKWEK